VLELVVGDGEEVPSGGEMAVGVEVGVWGHNTLRGEVGCPKVTQRRARRRIRICWKIRILLLDLLYELLLMKMLMALWLNC